MKKLFIMAALFLVSSTGYSQCNQYYKLKKGTSWAITSYNAKGKLEGKMTQNVVEYKETSSGFEAELQMVFTDDKGEEVMNNTTTLTCKDGVVYFDVNDLVPQAQMEAMQNFEISMEGNGMEIPANLKAGQQLKDAHVIMHIDASPMKMTFKIDVTDRKVVAEENLHTPAGDFNCFKLSQKTSMKTMGTIETKSIEWYAKEVGMVKSESYNKKGKMMGYSILTAYHY